MYMYRYVISIRIGVGFPKYQNTEYPKYQKSKVPNTIMRPYIFVTRFLDGPRLEAYHLDTP
jgi:hypothetical protein